MKIPTNKWWLHFVYPNPVCPLCLKWAYSRGGGIGDKCGLLWGLRRWDIASHIRAPCARGKRSAGAYASRHIRKGLLNPLQSSLAAMGEAHSQEGLPLGLMWTDIGSTSSSGKTRLLVKQSVTMRSQRESGPEC